MDRIFSAIIALFLGGIVTVPLSASVLAAAEAHAAGAREKSTDPHAGEKTGHDERAGQQDDHGREEHRESVRLTAEQMKEFGIEVGAAESGSLDVFIDLPAEIAFNGGIFEREFGSTANIWYRGACCSLPRGSLFGT
jgi:hypothetical protein